MGLSLILKQSNCNVFSTVTQKYTIQLGLGLILGLIFRHELILRLILTMFIINTCVGIGVDTEIGLRLRLEWD